MGVCYEALGISLSKIAPGADLGGGGKYSNESFEDRSGEGLHVNSSWVTVKLAEIQRVRSELDRPSRFFLYFFHRLARYTLHTMA